MSAEFKSDGGVAGLSSFFLNASPDNNFHKPGKPSRRASVTILINCAIGSENKPVTAAPVARTPKALNLKVSNANAALPASITDPILSRLDTIDSFNLFSSLVFPSLRAFITFIAFNANHPPNRV